MTEYKWQCPRCGVKFIERSIPAGNAGQCWMKGCKVVHTAAVPTGSGQNPPVAVRPGQTADLREINR